MGKKCICFDVDEKRDMKNIKYSDNDDLNVDLDCDDYGCSMEE